MKKIIITIAILFSFVIGEEIQITTWNIANFGETKLDNQEAMDKVLEVLSDDHVICLQEINQVVDVRGDSRNSAEILKDRLAQKTGLEWRLTLSDETGEGGKKERYAFLWRAGLGNLVNSEIVEFTHPDLQTERGYFVTDFNFRGEDIKIVSLHAKASGRVAERKLQWEEIANNLSNLPQETRIFVVGDLNMEHNRSFERNFSPLLDIGLKTSLDRGQLTTLRKNRIIDGSHLAKQVDYIFAKNVEIKNPKVEDFVLEFFQDQLGEIDIEKANQVSDHLPISLKIDIPNDFPPTFKMATWRVRRFSSSSRDENELFTIKSIVQKYDFIALQDVRDQEVIERLVEKLKLSRKEYDFEVKLPYAFLWNKEFITQQQAARFTSSGSFQRRPVFSSFKAGNFDFVVLTHHTTTRSLTATKEEIRQLPTVFREVQNQFPNEKDIILTGCFNRAPRFSEWEELLGTGDMFAAFRRPVDISTVGTNISDRDVVDNFFFDLNEVTEQEVELGVDKFDEQIFANDDRTASKEVSGNRPCFVEFSTKDND
ncbi:endonuclease/exonuclease/phosphatase family protein [Candidatus Uabimicrobium amorphum]|uniref:Deoxyribonuclease n=1 Tax=Uabimicrobium amorphum TaxID=2596890 RepID=A0A5S9IIR4_UABAM|nr:endonuclease/exonuclease/phosphatase family protein [Candidatus Uabimicrobium amorphum]BBM82132.1 deoxyribonuclease [Candidatus Uabimicrobium amorphum]